MRILIFGGVGFIGTNIAKLALEKNHEVVAVDDLSRKGVEKNLSYLKNYPKFHFIRGNIRRVDLFSRLPKKIDRIINMAADTSVPESIRNPVYNFEINVRGHLNILEFAKRYGKVPVIFGSSNKVYTDKINTYRLVEKKKRYGLADPNLKKGFSEEGDVDGVQGYTNSPYGASKLAAEKYTREYWHHYDLPMVINRMSCIYGLFQKGTEEQGWVDWFLRAKKNKRPITIYGNGKQVRDVLYGFDLAELYLHQAENIQRCNGQTFNVGGGPEKGFNISLLELIELIDDLFPGEKLRYTFRDWRKSDHKFFISDITEVTSVTGWKPKTEIQEGLITMWKAYERENS